MTHTVDPRIAALSDVVNETLQSVQGTTHHLAPLTLTVLREKLVEALAPFVQSQRAAVVAEVIGALQERAAEFSELAEEEMRPSLEERAQEWYSAAEVAAKLKRAKTEADGG